MTAHRQPIGDRRFAGARYTAAIGPVDLPGGESGVRDRLVAIARQGPHTRVGLIPDPMSARWNRDLARAVEVRVLPNEHVDDVGVMLERASDTAQAPLDVLVVDDHVFVTLDHAIGDGVFVTELLAALTQPEVTSFPSDVTEGVTVTLHPSARALSAALRHRPTAVARSLMDVAHPPGAPGPQRTSPAPQARTRSVVVASAPGFPRRLREMRDAHFPGATASATLSWSIDRCLRAIGLPMAPTLTAMVNLRRHLPPGIVCTGNFVGAVTAPSSSPQAMTRAIQERVTSTDLVVRQALSDAVTAVRPGRMREPHRKRDVPGAPLRLVVSDLCGSAAVPTIRWRRGSAASRVFGLSPLCNRSDELDLIYSRVDDRLFVTARFFDGVHDADSVRSAIRDALLEPADAR